ncbi:MAG: hypothetical protein R3D33_04140 [Hyphomicrobiaceae bacterium]
MTMRMRVILTASAAVLATGLAVAMPGGRAALAAEAATGGGALDAIGRFLGTSKAEAEEASATTGDAATTASPADPREGDESYEQAKRLLSAIDSILEDAAEQRADARKLPSKDEYILTPVWTETREDREAKIRTLLDAALGIVTDVPIVELQKGIEERRQNIREIEDTIAQMRRKQLTAPKDALMPGILTDTVDSLEKEIGDLNKRIEDNRAEITKTKADIHAALTKAGIEMDPDQLELLLDSVLSGDLVRLVAAFTAARSIDEQLAKAVQATGDNLGTARKFFAMHSALFAMLVHAQDSLIGKIDGVYLPRLGAIVGDIKRAREETRRLLKDATRPDQKRALEANLKSQDFAERVATFYRSYLLKQREQLADARLKAVRDLKIADNTYETVEASFQLNALIKDAAASFEAIQKLEAPGFDQIFENQELRREFESLTRSSTCREAEG